MSKLTHSFYLLLNTLQALAVFLLVELDLVPLAFLVAIVGKWQIFFGGSRFLWVHLRANSCDLLVVLSTISLMSIAPDQIVRIGLAVFFWIWLVLIKPRSETWAIGLQALLCQLVGLIWLFQLGHSWIGFVVVLVAWLIGLISARHFLGGYLEPMKNMFIFSWALVVGELTWILWRWLVDYVGISSFRIPQPALVITIFSYCMAIIYHDHSNKRLNKKRLYVHMGFCSILIALILLTTGWRVSV